MKLSIKLSVIKLFFYKVCYKVIVFRTDNKMFGKVCVVGGHPLLSRPSLEPATSRQTPVWEADTLLSELKARPLV